MLSILLQVVVLGRVWQRSPNETPVNGPPARRHRSATTNAVRHLPLKIPRQIALKVTIERQLSRRDVPLREKTLWRMLYETAARASEILALDGSSRDTCNCGNESILNSAELRE